MDGFVTDYGQRLQALVERRTAPVDLLAKPTQLYGREQVVDQYRAAPHYELYNSLVDEGTAVRYTVGAMARVDPKYTEITYAQGERVRKQLLRAFGAEGFSCNFEHQGSVTNDTHIKVYSDIDLLAITQRFTTLEPPQKPLCPYNGNPADDLKEIRQVSAAGLRSAFPQAKVDESGPKSVEISGGSLSRKVDVVPANWYDTNSYAQSQAKRNRAIQILDIKTGKRSKNFPFMHNYLIELRNSATRGGLKKVVRLMKSLRYDSGAVSLSSYDITAIAYRMPEYRLLTSPGEEIGLLVRLKEFLDLLAEDSGLRDELLVPDESRPTFIEGHATEVGLNELRDEVDDLVEAVSRNRQKSFERLAEARVAY